jgi:hypothetical protein
MGVECWNIETSTPSLALMELLANRLGWQTTPAKSLVIPLQGGGDVSLTGLFK